MSDIDLEGLDPEIESDAEKVHRLGRIVVGAIPVVGGPLLEVFNTVFESPMNRRRTETMVQIGQVVKELIEKRVVTEEDLQNNEAFVSTVAEVCSIAMRNHQEVKLEALRNAVKNSALSSCPSDDYRQIFLNFVDACTVSHIRLMKLFDDPATWISEHGITPPYWSNASLAQVVACAMPELIDNREILDTIWADLFQKGLVGEKSLDTALCFNGKATKQTSDFGSKLVAFLS